MTTNQHACNIAGYLAADVIKASLQSALDSYNSGKTIVQAFATIIGLIPAIGVVIDVIAGGVYVLYQALTSGTVGHYTDALADTALWSDMTCAIYAAIRADGHVTDANYPALLANVRGVTYAHADVVTTIGDFVAQLGASGMEHAQQVGALNSADCSNCHGGWCYQFVGVTINTPPWTMNAAYGAGAANRWSIVDDVLTALPLPQFGLAVLDADQVFAPTHIDTVEIHYTRDAAAGSGDSYYQSYGYTLYLHTDVGAFVDVAMVNATISAFTLHLDTAPGDAAGLARVQRVVVRGTGVCPFGAPNC